MLTAVDMWMSLPSVGRTAGMIVAYAPAALVYLAIFSCNKSRIGPARRAPPPVATIWWMRALLVVATFVSLLMVTAVVALQVGGYVFDYYRHFPRGTLIHLVGIVALGTMVYGGWIMAGSGSRGRNGRSDSVGGPA